jgi:hypothetical protein
MNREQDSGNLGNRRFPGFRSGQGRKKIAVEKLARGLRQAG